MRKRLVASLVCVVLGGSAAMACGGSSSTDLNARSSGSDGGTSDGGGPAEGDKPYTLDDVCERTGPILCDLRKPCCESGPGFDQAGCLAHAAAECAKDVADVRAGRATFHGDRLTECIPKFKVILASCTLSYDLLQEYARDIAGCQLFEGQLAEGASCERGSQCAGGDKDTLPGCNDDTKKCTATKLLAEGAACTLGGPNAGLCEKGLYCDVSFASQPFAGVCKKKTNLGVACDKDKKPASLECGLSNYCEASTAVCTVGKGGGAACESDLDCASISCVKPDGGAAGTCAEVAKITKPEECKGP